MTTRQFRAVLKRVLGAHYRPRMDIGPVRWKGKRKPKRRAK